MTPIATALSLMPMPMMSMLMSRIRIAVSSESEAERRVSCGARGVHGGLRGGSNVAAQAIQTLRRMQKT